MFIAPILVWKQAIAPSGLMLYRGPMFPQWRGNFSPVALSNRTFARVRDVRTADGAIYMLTDESNGRLFRFEALAEAAAAPAITNTPK